MAFRRPGATVLLVENMPEMHASFTESRWRRHARELSAPSRRAMEWMLLEVADIVYVIGVAEESVRGAFSALVPAARLVVPYAAIAGVIIGAFSLWM